MEKWVKFYLDVFRNLARMTKWDGKVLADLSVVPLGTGSPSVSKEVAQVETILKRFPLKTNLHASGTNLEGHWDDVCMAIKAIHAELHDSGLARVYCNMRWGTRTDKSQTIEDKINKVNKILQEHV
jgi:uncharacterized protein (TIGR00106 family)